MFTCAVDMQCMVSYIHWYRLSSNGSLALVKRGLSQGNPYTLEIQASDQTKSEEITLVTGLCAGCPAGGLWSVPLCCRQRVGGVCHQRQAPGQQLYCTALHCWLQVNTAQSRHSSGTGLPLFLATVTATIALLNNM